MSTKTMQGRGQIYDGEQMIGEGAYTLFTDASGHLPRRWGQIVTDRVAGLPLEPKELVLHLEDGHRAKFFYTGHDGLRTYQIKVSDAID